MKLMILDGNSIINRAYYGVRPLTTRDGRYTHAIYGFLNIMERMENEETPDALCVAFDLKGPTFRHLQYDKYKATRSPMPEELAQQLPEMKKVLRAMRIPIYSCEGWEADDILGTVGRCCTEQGWDCVIVTGDRDSLQLVDEHVSVKLIISRPGNTTATLYTPAVFREEYGFAPARLIDLKALMGDSSDNIPGVPGVGKKTASDLLLRYGSLQGVYDHLDDAAIRPKLREKLEAGRDSAYLSYDLATIRSGAPISFSPADALRREPDQEALLSLFRQLEFIRLIDRYHLRENAPTVAAPAPAQVESVALPVEGTLCAVLPAGEDSLAVAWDKGCCVASFTENHEVLQRFLNNKTPKICMDLKRMMHLLQTHGLPADGFVFDAALAAYTLDPGHNDYQLNRLCTAYLGREAGTTPVQQASCLLELEPVLRRKLADQKVETLYSDMEFPLIHVLFRMEDEGIVIDRAALAHFGAMLSQRISGCERAIFDCAGGPFNINSTRQLGELLFEKLGLPPEKKTKTGYSTNAEILEKLADRHPIVPAILDYRMLTKLRSTYAEGLLKEVREDGRIHTTFQNMVTATGRLSSTEPNLQNIPVRTELGSEIRKMFVTRPGWVLVDADYSQIELRVLAHIAGDTLMRQAFLDGVDIHAATASQVFGVPQDQVTPLQRRHAKAVNFGIVYGISEFSLSKDIGVTRSEAKAYIESYLNRYSGVRAYMRDIVDLAKKQGYVSTLYGRRRYIPELKSSNYAIRQSAERIALNTPVQGTAADIIKLAMLRVDRALTGAGLQARLILQVHDELIVECPQEEAGRVCEIVRTEMENAASLTVPLVAEAKFGNSWYEAK